MPPIEEQFRSIHEAAHAVAALVLGGSVHSLTLHKCISINNSVLEEVVILLAGSEAPLKQWGKLPSPHGGEDDIEQAERLLNGTGTDLEKPRAVAASIVADHFETIHFIAAALREEGSLPGEKVQELFDACYPA